MKICVACGENKDESLFAKKGIHNGKQRYRSDCRDCVRLHDRKRYAEDPKRRETLLNSKMKSVSDRREYVYSYLKFHPCVDCGNSDIRVLEFDHVRGIKVDNVSVMVVKSAPIEKIQEEIDKCDVRCANCHRIVTIERGNWSSGKY